MALRDRTTDRIVMLDDCIPVRIVRPLFDRISEAISWGIPDHESRGLSSEEFTKLLAEARDEIVRLQKRIQQLEKEHSSV